MLVLHLLALFYVSSQAQTHVNNIEDRLRGILKNKTKPRGLPLSVEGHVRHLIKVKPHLKNHVTLAELIRYFTMK